MLIKTLCDGEDLRYNAVTVHVPFRGSITGSTTRVSLCLCARVYYKALMNRVKCTVADNMLAADLYWRHIFCFANASALSIPFGVAKKGIQRNSLPKQACGATCCGDPLWQERSWKSLFECQHFTNFTQASTAKTFSCTSLFLPVLAICPYTCPMMTWNIGSGTELVVGSKAWFTDTVTQHSEWWTFPECDLKVSFSFKCCSYKVQGHKLV